MTPDERGFDVNKRPPPPTIETVDVAELSRTLGEMLKDLRQLRADFDDYTRQTHGGVDADARRDIASLQTNLTALTTRVGVTENDIDALQSSLTTAEADIAALETWRSEDETKIDALYPTHNNTAHNPDYSEVTHAHAWGDITSKPSTFPPEAHSNSAHSPAFSDVAHDHDADYVDQNTYDTHTHDYQDQDTQFFPTYGPDDPHTHSFTGGDQPRTTDPPS
jgi:hypothetical protein